MKTTEEIQQTVSGQTVSGRSQSPSCPPGANGRVGDSARKQSPRAAIVLGIGIIFAGLLITITGGPQGRAPSYEQGATAGGICDLISAEISDLVRAWRETSVHITVEGDGERYYTLTYGRIVLMLRCPQYAVSLDEQREVQRKNRERALIELGEPNRPIVTTESYSDGREVAYGDAIDDNWTGWSHVAGVGLRAGREEVTHLHQEALEWFRQRLAAQHGSQRACFQ
jgi:hypothetical protein